MTEEMAQVRITEAEVAGNSPRRTIPEILALMRNDSTAVMDADFARDVEAGIEAHREPLDASKWV